MPIFQPVYPTPYHSPIDVTKSNDFSCTIRGECKAYQFFIYTNIGSTLTYTVSKTTLSTPLYYDDIFSITVPSSSGMVNGTDYKWEIWLYGNLSIASGTAQFVSQSFEDENAYITLSASDSRPDNFYNGYYVEYAGQTIKIIKYDSSTKKAYLNDEWNPLPSSGGAYNIVEMVQFQNNFFKARSTPSLTLNVPVTISQYSYTFQASFSQAQGSYVTDYTMTVYDSTYNSSVSDNSNAIVKTITSYDSRLSMNVDGFLNNQTYCIGISVTDSDGRVTTINPSTKMFTVSYDVPVMAVKVYATPLPDLSAVLVDYSEFVEIIGVVSQTNFFEYLNDYLSSGNMGLRIFNTELTCGVFDAYDKTCGQWDALGLTCKELEFFQEFRS